MDPDCSGTLGLLDRHSEESVLLHGVLIRVGPFLVGRCLGRCLLLHRSPHVFSGVASMMKLDSLSIFMGEFKSV